MLLKSVHIYKDKVKSSHVSYWQNFIVAVKMKQVVKNFLLDLPEGINVLYTNTGRILKILEGYLLFN